MSTGEVRSVFEDNSNSISVAGGTDGAAAAPEMDDIAELARRIEASVARVIVGKSAELELLLVALLCEGHVLIEDVPGIGKTTLAKALARSLGCSFHRVQFTPDLLPSDITGISIYNQQTAQFEFAPRPHL